MPRKGYKMTEEHKQKIREANSGEKNGFYGKTHSKEVKEHLSKLATGRVMSEETKKKISKGNKGKKHCMPERWYASMEEKAERQRGATQTKESNLKRSLTLKGRVFTEEHKQKLSGSNHPRYKGGKPKKYPKEFSQQLKESVRDREGRSCLVCGISENDIATSLVVHHIDNNVNNNSLNNLVAICFSCHSKIHNTHTVNPEFIIKSYQDKLLS